MSTIFLIRLLIVGDTSVGKTSLLLRFNENYFSPTQKTTIGVDYKAKEIKIDNEDVKLQVRSKSPKFSCSEFVQIWDTAGQERFRSMTSAFYNRAQGVVVTFDVSQRSSFESLRHWISDVHQFAPRGCVIILCANKIDLPSDRISVRPEEYKAFAEEHKFTLFEASAFTGENVVDMFIEISRQILVSQRSTLHEVRRTSTDNIVLFQGSVTTNKKSRWCC